jgi:hypothetical protein
MFVSRIWAARKIGGIRAFYIGPTEVADYFGALPLLRTKPVFNFALLGFDAM